MEIIYSAKAAKVLRSMGRPMGSRIKSAIENCPRVTQRESLVMVSQLIGFVSGVGVFYFFFSTKAQ